MKQTIVNKYQINIIIFILISTILFFALDYLIQINLENFNIIVLKNSSKNDIENLDTKINQLNEQLNQLRQKTVLYEASSYPTLGDVKQVSKKYSLSVAKINKNREIDHNKTSYNISFQGSIYNIIKFLNSFESNYINDIDQLILQPNDLSGEKLTLQISILLKT